MGLAPVDFDATRCGHLDVGGVRRERLSRRATDGQVVHDRSYSGAVSAARTSSISRLKRMGIAQPPKHTALSDTLFGINAVNQHAALARHERQ